MRMANIYAISLGCPKNRVDTERLLGALPGAHLVESIQEAACIFINTCAFITPAVEESVRVILRAARDAQDAADGGGTPPFLVVAGCLVGRYGEKALAPDMPEVDVWLDNREIYSWPEKLRNLLGLSGVIPHARLISTAPSYAWLKISDGCNHACSFCTIPAIRGPFRSAPPEDLEREAGLLLSRGVKELVLVAQDTSAWGKDLDGKHSLKSLLDILLPLPGLARLRLMYLYPAGITRDLLRYFRDAGPAFVPYFDVPLQHAHPDVLARMGRPFAHNPLAVIERIREYFPGAALRTSMIVGFPGETEAAFEYVREFVAHVRFHHLGVFAFQAEEGTSAAALPKRVATRIARRRRDALMGLQAGISAEMLAACKGQRLQILVDSPHPECPGLHVGRAWFQAPENDGITYVSGPGVHAGALLETEVIETRTYDLVALAENATVHT